jgi:hypothetical protein
LSKRNYAFINPSQLEFLENGFESGRVAGPIQVALAPKLGNSADSIVKGLLMNKSVGDSQCSAGVKMDAIDLIALQKSA